MAGIENLINMTKSLLKKDVCDVVSLKLNGKEYAEFLEKYKSDLSKKYIISGRIEIVRIGENSEITHENYRITMRRK